MDLAKAFFVGNVLATGIMTGVIWFVQIVGYPLFAAVGATAFADYHTRHSDRTTRVVALPMLLELILSGALLANRPLGMSAAVAWLGFALSVAAWSSTFLVAVPLHGKLGVGHDPAIIARLVATNWFRTLIWTAHLGLLTYALIRLLP